MHSAARVLRIRILLRTSEYSQTKSRKTGERKWCTILRTLRVLTISSCETLWQSVIKMHATISRNISKSLSYLLEHALFFSGTFTFLRAKEPGFCTQPRVVKRLNKTEIDDVVGEKKTWETSTSMCCTHRHLSGWVGSSSSTWPNVFEKHTPRFDTM